MAKARKEIDKESMYQKIMPSSMRAAQPAAEEPAAEVKKPVTRPRKPSSAAARPAAPHSAAAYDEEDSQLSRNSLPTMTHPRQGMPAAATQETWEAPAASSVAKPAIVNIMERLIDEKIDQAMDKFHCCTCPKCRQDITAFALNKLHPKYIVEEPVLLEEAMADKESNTQVTTALVQAILKVKANPKH